MNGHTHRSLLVRHLDDLGAALAASEDNSVIVEVGCLPSGSIENIVVMFSRGKNDEPIEGAPSFVFEFVQLNPDVDIGAREVSLIGYDTAIEIGKIGGPVGYLKPFFVRIYLITGQATEVGSCNMTFVIHDRVHEFEGD